MKKTTISYRLTVPSEWGFVGKKNTPQKKVDFSLCSKNFKTKNKVIRTWKLCPSGTICEKWIYFRFHSIKFGMSIREWIKK